MHRPLTLSHHVKGYDFCMANSDSFSTLKSNGIFSADEDIMAAPEIINRLHLQPHPEGGWYRETWKAENPGRATATCIFFLLQAGESSHWHRIDATELWLYHSGSPLILSLSKTDHGPAIDRMLTPDLSRGVPQLIVPQGYWQTARSTGEYTLVSCTVSPGFEFDGFELASPGFDIPRSAPDKRGLDG